MAPIAPPRFLLAFALTLALFTSPVLAAADPGERGWPFLEATWTILGIALATIAAWVLRRIPRPGPLSAPHTALPPSGPTHPDSPGAAPGMPAEAGEIFRGLVALAGETDSDRFFHAVAQHVAELLRAEHAFVAVPAPTSPGHLRTLAFHSRGTFAAHRLVPTTNSPLAEVVERHEIVIRQNLRARFPSDPLAAELAADALIGIPLGKDPRHPVGILAVLGRAPIDPSPSQLDVLRILAARIGCEIDRIRTTEQLRDSEERFRELADNSEDVLWVFDLVRRRLLYLGPAFTRLTGVDVESCRLAPRRILRLMDRRDRSRWLRSVSNALRAPNSRYSIEYRIRRPGTASRWILDQGVVIRDAGNRPVRLSGVARDITDRKEAELALAAERGRFRDLFENSPDAVFVESCDGIVLDVNRAACQLHRLSHERLLGRHVTELVPENLREETRRRFRLLVSGELSVAESAALRSDGSSVPVELQVSRIPHEGRDALLVHTRDISARKEAEAFLAGQNRILEGVATGQPLADTLAQIARLTESRIAGSLAWTLVNDAPAEGRLVCPSAAPDLVHALAERLVAGGSLATQLALGDSQPVVVDNAFILADSTGPETPLSTPSQRADRRHLAAVRLVSGSGDPLGAFGLVLPPGHPVLPADLDVQRLAASLARLAIERHRTDVGFQESTARLRDANDALLRLARSEAISGGNLAAALGEITESAARTVQADRVTVWLLDEGTAILRKLHEYAAPPRTASLAVEHRLADLPRYLDAISRERLLAIADSRQDPRLQEFHRPTAAELPPPRARLDAGVRLRGRLAGILVLESDRPPRAWKSEEELVAGSLADIVAMALQAGERRCIEDALRQSEEAYRSVVSALAEGVMLVDRQGSFLAFNDSATEILGISGGDLATRPLRDPAWQTIRPDGSPIPISEFPAEITLRTGTALTDSVMGVRRPDGRFVWISINTRPFARDDAGEVGSVVISFTDITRRHEAERALREGHDLVRAISEVQAGFIADADPARSIGRMLQTFAGLAGADGGVVAECTYPPGLSPSGAPVLQRFPAVALHDRDPLEMDAALPDALLEEARDSGASLRPTGPSAGNPTASPRPHVLAVPLRHDTEVVGVLGLARYAGEFPPDTSRRLAPLLITCAGLLRAIRSERQRKEAEARIRQLNAELEERVERRTADLHAINRELGEFAYVVTHDLKAPLRGIHQVAEWLEQDHGKQVGPSGRHLLGLMRERVLNLQRLIDGLLACARVGRSPEPVSRVSTRDLVRHILAAIAPPPHIHFSIDRHLPVIEGNPERLHQVFQNLLDNAIKYLDKPRGHIAVAAVREESSWRFTVADNGPGIPQKYREKVFHIFQRLHESKDVPGTGLGLTLVRRIVDTRGGRIWIEAPDGGGTAVCFTWPDQARERAVGSDTSLLDSPTSPPPPTEPRPSQPGQGPPAPL